MLSADLLLAFLTTGDWLGVTKFNLEMASRFFFLVFACCNFHSYHSELTSYSKVHKLILFCSGMEFVITFRHSILTWLLLGTSLLQNSCKVYSTRRLGLDSFTRCKNRILKKRLNLEASFFWSVPIAVCICNNFAEMSSSV